MKKTSILLFTLFISSSIYASCPTDLSDEDLNFCEKFKNAAICYCTDTGLPKFLCSDMNSLYSRMTTIFRSLENACAYQKHTDKQTCINNWNCYRLGGTDSYGKLCSSTGNKCA